jgi:NADPH:quinone reductase-like Zn-dependent oxidoreductase
MVSNHTLAENRRVLTPDGRLVIIGGASGEWLGPMMRPLGAMMLSPFVDQEMGMMLAHLYSDDLIFLAELMQAGKVTPVVDRSYRLSEVPAAIRYSEEGHARGKIIIDLE